ncbi:DUF4843 domain-containing protein [Flavobacteriaceae bacterium]|nr:DUF4843 domain-containing protein [Flavobacteriaceae bacterium]
MKKLLLALITVVTITACSDSEPPIYDNIDGQTLVTFKTNASNLEILVDDVGEADIEVNVTTASSTDRVYDIVIDTENSSALADTYTIPSTVTIPANEYTGTIKVTGVDIDVETSAETVVISLSTPEAILTEGNHTINIFQVCPIRVGYMEGDYLITQVSAFIDGPTLNDGAIVELVATGATTRNFQTPAYIDYCATPLPGGFSFNLVCGEIVVPSQDSNCTCGDGTDWFTEAIVNETYDIADDTDFLVTFTDDTIANCGPAAQTTYRFQKQ